MRAKHSQQVLVFWLAQSDHSPRKPRQIVRDSRNVILKEKTTEGAANAAYATL